MAQDHNYNETIRRLGSFGERVRICRQSPKDAARSISDGSLDFVYLVDRHYRTALRERLNTWAKKVRPGGILAGHNYLDGVLPSGHFEVKSTVDEWALERGWEVQCTGEAIWRSWIIRLPTAASRGVERGLRRNGGFEENSNRLIEGRSDDVNPTVPSVGSRIGQTARHDSTLQLGMDSRVRRGCYDPRQTPSRLP